MDEGVDRITVVTTIVLPLETERNVDCEIEGVKDGLGVRVEVEEVVVDVGDGGGVEVVDEVECESEVDGGRDDELSSEVLVGGGVDEGLSLEVDSELELR